MDNEALLGQVEARLNHLRNKFWKEAKHTLDMYEGCKLGSDATYQGSTDPNPFNILYANTEVLIPALYSATPRPDVRAKPHHPSEPATASQALLGALVDDTDPGLESFDSAMEGAVTSALVPGAGGVRLRAYPGTPRPIRWEEFKYNQLVWAAGSKWSRLPWIAFLHPMTKEEIVQEFGVDAAKVQAPTQRDADEGEKSLEAAPYTVLEVWLRATREVVFLSREVEGLELRRGPDELHLAGFYPTPGLLTFVKKPSGLDPTPLYNYYRNQAEELNRVTVRLNRVLAAIKVRGLYNPLLGDELTTVLADTSMENALKPTQNPMDLQGKGLDSQIWLLPIDKLITVAQQLYQARDAIKRVIQEITGLSDIVRGSTMASETATAQSLKDKWGTLRLRRMQRVVALYVRDLLRMAVDVAGVVMPPEQWKEITGLPYPMQAEKQQQILQYQQVAMQAEQAQQPPPPPPPVLRTPSWEEVLAMLVNDGRRNYAVDIEVASTLDSEAQADQEEVTTFVGALAQLVQGLSPIASMGPEGLKASKTLLVALARKFKFGREVEEAFKALPEQLPAKEEASKGPSPEEMQLAQMEMKSKQEELAFKREERQFKLQEMQRKAVLAQQAHQLEMEKLQASHQAEMQVIIAKSRAAMAQAAMKPKAPAKSSAPA